jgi:ankyrin repeat protein
MGCEDVRDAVDAGDVDALRDLLRHDPALVTALVAAPDIQPTSPLTYVGMARFYGYARHARTGELAHLLMDAGADQDDETGNGAPLYCAASHGDADVVRALLEAGADVELTDAETPSETALRAAVVYGWPEIVDLLVAHGAQPRSVIEAAGVGDLSAYDLRELSDRERANALRAAATNERLGAIDQLLAAGTPVDATSEGYPAIHWARQHGRERAVAHLTRRARRVKNNPSSRRGE